MKLFRNVFYAMDITEEMVTFKLVAEYSESTENILTRVVHDLRIGSEEFVEFEEAIFIRQQNFMELRFKIRVWLNDIDIEKIPKYCLSRLSQEAKSLRAELRNRKITKDMILGPLTKLFNIYATDK